MTEKQKIFADEYLIDLHATRAYLVAYPRVPNENTAAVNGSKLLRNTNVASYIQQRMQERHQRTEVTPGSGHPGAGRDRLRPGDGLRGDKKHRLLLPWY